jgi:hypothetical protein
VAGDEVTDEGEVTTTVGFCIDIWGDEET